MNYGQQYTVSQNVLCGQRHNFGVHENTIIKIFGYVEEEVN